MGWNNKYKLLVSNTAIFAIGNVLVKFIAFFLMPLYTSYLTTEQYGVSELLNSMIEIVLPVITLCVIEALYRFSIDEKEDQDELFVNSLVIVIAGDLFVFIGCTAVYHIFAYEYIYNFFFLYISTAFYKITTQFARGKGHIKRFACYGVLNSLFLVGSNIVLIVFLKGGVGAYLNSFSISFMLAGITAFVFSGEYRYINIKKLNAKTVKRMLVYSIPVIPNMLSWWINGVSNRYFVMFFWGSNAAGIYTAASKLPSMINLVTSVFQQAWQYSAAAEIGEEGECVFFSNVLRVYTYICTSVCALLVFMNKILCSLLLKAEFYAAWKYVPLLLLAALFGCLSTYFGTFYQALKNNIMLMVSTMAGAIINIIINLILTPNLGGFGAAIATVASYIIVTLIRMIDIQKQIHIKMNRKKIIYQISLLIVYGVLASFLEGTVSYAVGLIFVVLILQADFYIVMQMIKKFKVFRQR